MTFLEYQQKAQERQRAADKKWHEEMQAYAKGLDQRYFDSAKANYLRFTRIPELEAELAEARRFLAKHGHLTPGWDLGDLAPLD